MASTTVGSKRSFAAMNSRTPEIFRLPRHLEYTSRSPSTGSTSSSVIRARPSPDLDSEGNTSSRFRYGGTRSFDPDASIVLVGARGTGKSSLGVIAANAFQMKLIDSDFSFQQMTGDSISSYRFKYGALACHQKALEVLDHILANHPTRCIIVCGLLAITKEAQVRLTNFATTHAIVHIIRDITDVQKYLKMDLSRVKEMMSTAERVYRELSNFEFYNISDHVGVSDEGSDGSSSATPKYLTKMAFHFLKFLASAIDIHNNPGLEKTFPLSRVAVESRSFTFSMVTTVEQILSPNVDVTELEVGADALELRIEDDDLLLASLSKSFSVVRRNTIIPVIFHAETSKASPKNSRYHEIVAHALKMAPDFVTLDLTLTDKELRRMIAAKGKTKLIAHFHSSDPTLGDWSHPHWIDAYLRAQSLGFDLVRLCWPAVSLDDNFKVQQLRAKISELGPSIPLIAYNTGVLGRTSCCFNPILQPVTHEGCDAQSRSDSEPRLTAEQVTKARFASFVFEPLNFFIMGASSAYSLSPAMHNAAYQACGMPHSYKTFQTPTVNTLQKLVNDDGFGGCSISLPFKLEVFSLAHSVSNHAKAIGAINTLIAVRDLDENGDTPPEIGLFKERNRRGPVKALYGENTDWIGIRNCVRRGLSPANAVSPRTTMLVIGAGGMARAAIYAMLQLGVRNIVLHNRTKANAEKIITHFQRLLDDKANGRPSSLTLSHPPEATMKFHFITSTSDPWPEAFRQPTIIVSCIPTHRIGENASPDFAIPEQWLESATGGVVMEVAYRNIRSPLLEQIRRKASLGWVTMDGLDLLPEQAFAQFELFTGRRAPRRLMRAEVLKGYRDEQGRPDPEIIEQRLAQIKDQDP